MNITTFPGEQLMNTLVIGTDLNPANEDNNFQVKESNLIKRIKEASKRNFDIICPHNTNRRFFTIYGAITFAVLTPAVAGYWICVGLGNLVFSNVPIDGPSWNYGLKPALVLLGITIITAIFATFARCFMCIYRDRQEWHQEEQRFLNSQRQYGSANATVL